MNKSPDKKLIDFKTALGWAGVAATERGICRVVLPEKDKKTVERELESQAGRARSSEEEKVKYLPVENLNKVVQLLKRYFSGARVSFDLPLDVRSYTPFQQAVWRAAAEIPYGETRSYAWIAKRIKNPRAARAVGQAMGANPIPIIIP